VIEHLFDEVLSAHVDGALDQAELAAVEAHLTSCADCSRRLQLLRATSRAVAGLPDEEPGPLDFSFLPANPTSVVSLPAPRGWRPPSWAVPVLAAAAVLVVAGGVGTLMLRQPTATSGAATALGQQDHGFNGPVSPSGGSVAGGLATGADRVGDRDRGLRGVDAGRSEEVQLARHEHQLLGDLNLDVPCGVVL